ncbi:heme-binding protein [Pseudomonas sp. PWP3-1b2]|uniref:heme-binding protein n=1 Tax=Pseudomonas sp. PWP3-1b2 TaxID=2804656 RepID=UPI003CF245A8
MLPRLLAVGGGHPLVVDGKLTGGIGISGGTYVQDQHIAEAALKAVGFDCP